MSVLSRPLDVSALRRSYLLVSSANQRSTSYESCRPATDPTGDRAAHAMAMLVCAIAEGVSEFRRSGAADQRTSNCSQRMRLPGTPSFRKPVEKACIIGGGPHM